MGLFDKFVKKGKEKNQQNKEINQKDDSNGHYEDVTFKYKDATINVRIKPISIENFAKLNKYKSDPEELVYRLLQSCLLNKHDNKQFTLEQVKQLFEFDLATKLGVKCLEVSNIPIKNTNKNNERDEEIDQEQNTNLKQKNNDERPYDIEAVKIFLSERRKHFENNDNSNNIDEPIRLTYDVEEIQKWTKFVYENNQKALEFLDKGEIEEATLILEENITALADTPVTYSYLTDIYRINDDYDNELRICNQAIECLVGSSKSEYELRKERLIKRENHEAIFSNDEELYEKIEREEKLRIKSRLIKGYYQTDEYKKEKEHLKNAEKEYLENNPTDFLFRGAKEYGMSLSSVYNSSEDMKSLLTLTGNGKYLEEREEYEPAISIYQEANKYDKRIFPNANYRRIEKRIEVCNNKIRKQKIKDLETKAKELEKIEPAQAIELYNELNILNPNLKKYDKRIEILKKKL